MADVRTACPRDCYDACGILVVQRPGKAPLVRGDPADPVSRGKLCRKCATAYNGSLTSPAERLTAPLRRVGPKGSGSFEQITADEAVALVADRLSDVIARHGAASVLNAHYTGTFAMIGYHFGSRLFNRLGATEVDPDTVCNNAGHAALDYLYGTSLDGFDPRGEADATAIVVWGANPAASGPHQFEHWLPESGAAVIVVDPVRTETAKAANLHLQPFPGSDAALAFGLMHVLWRDGLLDRPFVEAHTVGFDRLEPMLADCTPEQTERLTAVPAGVVEEAAHLYGAGPAMLWIGQGLQRQATGGNVVRAVSLLPALTGNFGRSGSGLLYLNGYETRGLDGDYLSGAALTRQPVPKLSQMDLAAALEDPGRSRALVCWNINIAASSPHQRRLRAALERDDLFTVVIDLFPTDTADLADVVLPAASFLEHDDIVASYFHHSLAAQVRAMDPPPGALTNSEWFRRLASAMGLVEPELAEDDRSILDNLVAQAGLQGGFSSLAAAGTVWPSPDVRLQFPGLSFPTPSGRVEIASERARRDGHPLVPLPLADPRPAGGRLRLLSPASPWTLNSSHGNDSLIRARLGRQAIVLNPRDAAERGLEPGSLARVANECGELTLVVETSDDVPPQVALCPKGRWPKFEPERANVNALNPGHKSDMGESSSVHSVEVTVEAFTA